MKFYPLLLTGLILLSGCASPQQQLSDNRPPIHFRVTVDPPDCQIGLYRLVEDVAISVATITPVDSEIPMTVAEDQLCLLVTKDGYKPWAKSLVPLQQTDVSVTLKPESDLADSDADKMAEMIYRESLGAIDQISRLAWENQRLLLQLRAQFIADHPHLPPKHIEAINGGTIILGMSTDEVMVTYGLPDSKNTSVDARGDYETWWYSRNNKRIMIDFSNGVVISGSVSD